MTPAPAAPPEADAEPDEDELEPLAAGRGVDPLDALLAIDQKPQDVTDTIPVPLIPARAGDKPQTVEFTVRVLGGEEIEELTDRCTRWVKRGRGQRVQELDNQRLERLLVATAVVKPDLGDPRLLTKFGVRHAEAVVPFILLPGTIDGLSSRILETSGYTDDLVAAGKG